MVFSAGIYFPSDAHLRPRICISTKLTKYAVDVWTVMEWECCIKSSEQGAKEGALFIQKHIIEAAQKSFDDFAGGNVDEDHLKRILGI